MCMSQVHLRHSPLFQEAIHRRDIAQGLMDSARIVEDKIVRQGVIKERFVMDKVQVIVNEFFLERAVIPLDVGVGLGASGIDESVRDVVCAKTLLKLTQILRAIIGLPAFDGSRIDAFEALIKVVHIRTGQALVVQGERELKVPVNGREEVVFDAICNALDRVGEDMAELFGLA